MIQLSFKAVLVKGSGGCVVVWLMNILYVVAGLWRGSSLLSPVTIHSHVRVRSTEYKRQYCYVTELSKGYVY
jgi:hypothetical protein